MPLCNPPPPQLLLSCHHVTDSCSVLHWVLLMLWLYGVPCAHVWRSQNRATQPNINDSRWNSCLSLNAVVLIELQIQSNKRRLLICSQWTVCHACSWQDWRVCFLHMPFSRECSHGVICCKNNKKEITLKQSVNTSGWWPLIMQWGGDNNHGAQLHLYLLL